MSSVFETSMTVRVQLVVSVIVAQRQKAASRLQGKMLVHDLVNRNARLVD